jgi:hypothetical protein
MQGLFSYWLAPMQSWPLGYVTDQLLAGLRSCCILTQMHQKGAPTGVSACHSQGEAGGEIDLSLELSAGAEKACQWAHAWALLLR